MDVREQAHRPPDGGEGPENGGQPIVPFRARNHGKGAEAVDFEEAGQERRQFLTVAFAHSGLAVGRNENLGKGQGLFLLERRQILLEIF